MPEILIGSYGLLTIEINVIIPASFSDRHLTIIGIILHVLPRNVGHLDRSGVEEVLRRIIILSDRDFDALDLNVLGIPVVLILNVIPTIIRAFPALNNVGTVRYRRR